MTHNAGITSVLREDSLFAPPPSFQQQAHIASLSAYQELWNKAKEQPENFWREQAHEWLHWHKPFTQVLDWHPPHAKWFADGRLNVTYNCIDRHLPRLATKPAIIWEGEPGERRQLTYAQLHEEVCRAANMLLDLGVSAGDRVTIYMPMVPELSIALLACARIGAIHSVVFAGFSSEALADRNNDAKSKLLITADGLWRRGQWIDLKTAADASLKHSPTVEKMIVFQRAKTRPALQPHKEYLWQDLMRASQPDHVAEEFPSEHPLFILYTSGSTGKPKGILHTSAGYLLGVTMTFHYVFDHKPNDVYWCTADIGWVTGHSYVTYGAHANGATVFMYEGAPTFPHAGRFWELIERYKISIFYTAPTAIRALMKAGDEHPARYDLSSLRLLGTVGEPINPKAWLWYRDTIGKGRCPIVDTWWQTETGAMMIAPLPGAVPTVPGTATVPFFGIEPQIVDQHGKQLPTNQGGLLVINKPWPSMARTIWGDDKRFRQTYWETIPGKYFTGDGARCDERGYFWIMGRIDDVLNVSGHRLSTMEIESALVHHPAVAEAAVVGKPDEIKGESICCFVSLRKVEPTPALKDELKAYVAKQIGALARPDEIRFTESLPKTRSGKIMRRLLRDIARGQEAKGDVSTLEDFTVLQQLRNEDEE